MGQSGESEEGAEPQLGWKLYVDSSITREKIGAGIIVEGLDGFKYEHTLEYLFHASNNAAEYEALIGGL